GLIIDRYGDVLSVQANTAGIDRLTPHLIEALDAELKAEVIVLRNDSAARALEGLPQEVKIAKGALSGPIEVKENGAILFADLSEGQKTGWFYDQRDNRAAAARVAGGRNVLDLYCYGGGFAVAAARTGATSVLAVDRSAPALELAAAAAKRNSVDGVCQ